LIFTGFTASQITAGSTGYFFVTFDVAAGAEKGNTVITGQITSTNNFLFNPSADKTGTSLPVSGSNTQYN
jgi:hypothetical protein